jgi:hypothetical protein
MKRKTTLLIFLGFVYCLSIFPKVANTKVIYNPEAAKQGVRKVKEDLVYLHRLLSDFDKTSIIEVYKQAYDLYLKMPQTWQINWSLIGEDPKKMQRLADESMRRINDYIVRNSRHIGLVKQLFNGYAEIEKLIQDGGELEKRADEAVAEYEVTKPLVGGYGKCGEEANKFYQDASLKYMQVAFAFRSCGLYLRARTYFEKQVKMLNKMGYKAINPIYYYLLYLSKIEAKTRANYVVEELKLNRGKNAFVPDNVGEYSNIKRDIGNLKIVWKQGGEDGQEWVKEQWGKLPAVEKLQYRYSDFQQEQNFINR